MSTSSALYEVVVAGEFASSAFQAILDRCQLQTDFIGELYSHEVVFEAHTSGMSDRARIRFACTKQMNNTNLDSWTFCTQSRPEPARMYPDTTVRQVVYCEVTAGNALAFASALGYRRFEDIYKRGFSFLRGTLRLQIFQYVSGDPHTIETSAWDTQPHGQWHMEIKSSPVRNTQETPIREQVDSVTELKTMMKSLLDLNPLSQQI